MHVLGGMQADVGEGAISAQWVDAFEYEAEEKRTNLSVSICIHLL
jgi:hypothetical protein